MKADFEKVFDSIEHKDLLTSLRGVGGNEAYVQLLEDIYTDATAIIHIDKDVSKLILIERGVRQGDTQNFHHNIRRHFQEVEPPGEAP